MWVPLALTLAMLFLSSIFLIYMCKTIYADEVGEVIFLFNVIQLNLQQSCELDMFSKIILEMLWNIMLIKPALTVLQRIDIPANYMSTFNLLSKLEPVEYQQRTLISIILSFLICLREIGEQVCLFICLSVCLFVFLSIGASANSTQKSDIYEYSNITLTTNTDKDVFCFAFRLWT